MKRAYLFEHEVDMTNSKKNIYEVIFEKEYDGEEHNISFGDLPKNLEDTDIIEYQSDPGHYSDNNSWDPFTRITISRPRLETDEEQKERLEKSQAFIEERKQGRYETYLKLKEEFDPLKKS